MRLVMSLRLLALRPRPSSGRLTALLVLLTAAAAWLWAHEGHAPLPTTGATVDAAKGLVLLSPDARKALGVQTAEVSLRPLDERVVAPATVVAPWQRHAYATTRLAGKVAAVHVRPGEAVAAGQPLADVESLELEALQLELLTALTDARLAAENLRHLEPAARQGVASEQQLQEIRARGQEHENAVAVARRKLLALGVGEGALDRLTRLVDPRPLPSLPVLSPLGGVVLRGNVQVGQVVEPAQALFEVADLSSMWVRVAVLERDLARIEPGQPLELRWAAYSEPEAVFPGTVWGKGLALDPKTQQGAVWAELPNPPAGPPRLLPGLYGQAQIVLRRPKGRVTVPAAALVRDGAEHYVLVEEGPGQYARHNIVVGLQAQGLVEVRSGQLVTGDRVVTVGSHELAALLGQGILRVSPEAAKTIGLRVEPAGRHRIADVVQAGGVVELPPDRRAVVSSRLPGTVWRIAIDRDQEVRPGQVVAEVASLELQNLQLDLLNQHLKLALLERTLERLRPLAQSSAVSPRQLREAESASQAARQRRESLRRRLEAVGLSAEQARDVEEKGAVVEALPVRAPVAGAVVRFHAALGQAVKPEDPLFEVHDLSTAVVRGFVSPQELARVRVGQPARVRLAAVPGLVADAHVVRSGQSLGPADRTLSVWAELKQPPRPPLLDGMLARLTLVVSESEPTLAVPREAVLRDGARAYLFLRRPDGAFERRPVETGRADDRLVEVTEGLREGEVVAVSGVADLQTGYSSVK
jgi:cobalt-zinc-cadmium efflux system membrane fusion protein